MRKSNLVKAMACFMAATMAVTCVPSVSMPQLISVTASAADIADTPASATPVEVYGYKWWTDFSDDYRITGDFDVTFDFTSKGGAAAWNSPVTVFTNGIPRGGSGYKEYAVVRSDSYGWANNTFTYEHSWTEVEELINAMKNANVKRNIVRQGSNFYIHDTITSETGNVITSTTQFISENAPDTITIFMTPDTASMMINSYSGNILAAGAKASNLVYESGNYIVSADNADLVTSNNDGTYQVALSKMFYNAKVVTMKPGLNTITLNCNNNVSRTVSVFLVEPNPCETYELTTNATDNKAVDSIKVALNQAFDITTTMVGKDKEHRVTTDPVIEVKEFTQVDGTSVSLPRDLQYGTLKLSLSGERTNITLEKITDNKLNKTETINKSLNIEGFRAQSFDPIDLEADSDITIDFINKGNINTVKEENWFNFVISILSTDSNANYQTLRADAYAFGDNVPGVNNSTENIKYTSDWKNWDEFLLIMKNARVSMNIKRNEASFTITSKITPLDENGNPKKIGDKDTYTYTAKMTYGAKAANISSAKRDAANRNTVTHTTVTPIMAGTGTLSVNCAGVGRKEINYLCVNNTCSAINVLTGNNNSSTTLTLGKSTPVTVIADGIDSDVVLNDFIQAEVADSDGTPVVADNDGNYDGAAFKLVKNSSDLKKGQSIVVYSVIPKVTTEAAITFKCGDKSQLVTFSAIAVQENSNTSSNGSTTPTTPTTPVTPEQPSTGPAITTGSAVDPGDANKPGDENKPGDNQPGNTEDPGNNNENPTTPEDPETPTTTKKKKAKVSAVKAAKGAKKVTGTVKLSSGKVVKKATVKVYVNNKKKKTVTTNSKGKFTAKLSKKLKKGDKVKVVITKSTIKKITKTVKVK